MAWTKVPPELEAYLDRLMAEVPQAEKRRMFGCPAYFVDDKLCSGAFQHELFLRLSPEDQEALFMQDDGAHSFTPMEGRPMREYVALSPAMTADEGALGAWIARAVAYTLTVPAKVKKPKRKC